MNTLRLHAVRFPPSETLDNLGGMKIASAIPSPFKRER